MQTRDYYAVIDWKELKKLTPYSRQHIHRLERQGAWPLRVQLGQNRVGWYWGEVMDHLKSLPRG